jgi:putative membrane protein
MAVITRRGFLLGMAFVPIGAPAIRAQTAAPSFIEAACASAQFQLRIAKAVAAKAVRPEAKALADASAAFRTEQIPQLKALAQKLGKPVRDSLDRELQAIADNLEPLDELEMSRRYAEAATQALDKEAEIYRSAAENGPSDVRAYAASTVDQIRSLAADAHGVLAQVRP